MESFLRFLPAALLFQDLEGFLHWILKVFLFIDHCEKQWRTQKIFMGVFTQWHKVVICIWCALFVTSQFDVIVLFPNERFGEVCWHNLHIFLYIHSPYFMSHCTEYKLLELQVRISEENTPNATIQQFVTAKISGCALKQGSKTHSSIRQSNLQRKNEATLMSCRIRAVEHRISADGLAGTHPGLKNRILLNYTRIENAHKVCKKTFDFVVIYRSPVKF